MILLGHLSLDGSGLHLSLELTQEFVVGRQRLGVVFNKVGEEPVLYAFNKLWQGE